MAYLGNVPARSFISFERQVFTIVNSQTAYTLSHSVTNENDIRLVINNIVQEPGSGKAYTASGTTLTLSAALVNGTDEMYCVFLGRAVGTVNAPAGSVTTSQIAADAVNGDKIADDSISDEHLDPTAITGQTAETTIADDDLILLSDTSASAALKKMTRANFVSGIGGVNTPAFEARLSNEPAVANNTWTKAPVNVEIYDVGGCYDNSTNYRFTPTTAGKYVFYFQVSFNALNDQVPIFAAVYKNGSTIWGDAVAQHNSSNSGTSGCGVRYTITAEANGSSDYFEAYAKHGNGNDRNFTAGNVFFGGYKLIE